MQYLLNGANWDFTDPMSIPNLLIAHIYITAIGVGLGLVIAFPIALLVARYTRIYPPVITTASIIYTLPSLAFMALLIPFYGLTLVTVEIPLVLYTQVVLTRNIVAAIRAVDPVLVEVGRAMGMNTRQLALRVTLPLAAPIIIAGVRVATVTTIGIAAISTFFGVSSLGDLIKQGISNYYTDQILAGAILLTLLAIVADVGLLGVQALVSRGQSVGAVS